MSQENKEKMRTKNSQMMKITLVSLLAVSLFLIEIYEIINDPANMVVIGSLGVFLLASVCAEMLLIRKQMEENAKGQDEAFDNVYRSEKAAYLLIRKYFDKMEQKMDSLSEPTDLPYKELIAAQKALAKAQINRGKQNTNALLISNDRLMQRINSIQNDVAKLSNNTGLSEQDQAVFTEGNRQVLDKQQEILDGLKVLETSLRNEILESADKMASMKSQHMFVPQQQSQIQDHEDIQPLDIDEDFSLDHEVNPNASFENSSESDLDKLLMQIDSDESFAPELDAAEPSELPPEMVDLKTTDEMDLSSIMPELGEIEEPELSSVMPEPDAVEHPELSQAMPELSPIMPELGAVEEPELSPIMPELGAVEEPELSPIMPEVDAAEPSELPPVMPDLGTADEMDLSSMMPELGSIEEPELSPAISEIGTIEHPDSSYIKPELGAIDEAVNSLEMPELGSIDEVINSLEMPDLDTIDEQQLSSAMPEMDAQEISPVTPELGETGEQELPPIMPEMGTIEEAELSSVMPELDAIDAEMSSAAPEISAMDEAGISSSMPELGAIEEPDLSSIMPELDVAELPQMTQEPDLASADNSADNIESVMPQQTISNAKPASSEAELQAMIDRLQTNTQPAAPKKKPDQAKSVPEPEKVKPAAEPETKNDSREITPDRLAAMIANLGNEPILEEPETVAEESEPLEVSSLQPDAKSFSEPSSSQAQASVEDDELEKLMMAMDIDMDLGQPVEDMDIDKILEVPISEEKAQSNNQVMSSDEIAALIANTELLSDPEPVKNTDLPDLSDPSYVMSSDEIAALIANM
jgi:hypothetical protein